MIEHEMQKTNHQEILIVEDNPDNLKFLTGILLEHGYNVRPASDGYLALRSVSVKIPDLILIDVEMPNIDGYEVCRRLKSEKKTKNIPVIFISAFNETTKKINGFNVGGVDYITKPFETDEVLARIRTHLHLRELSERLEQMVDARTKELLISNQLLRKEITERKQVEKALRQSETKYRLLVETMNEGMAVQENQILNYVNNSFCKMLGYSKEELIGKKISTLFDKKNQKKLREQMSLRKKRKNIPYEIEFTAKNGEKISTIISPSSTHFDGKIFRGSSAIFTNITTLKQKEMELKHLQDYLSNIINSMPSLLIGVDADGKVTQWNKKAEEKTKITTKDAIGELFTDVFPQMAPEMEKIIDSIHSREIKQEQKKAHPSKNGTRYENMTIYPLIVNGVEGAVIRVDDVTDEHIMQEQLHQSQKMDAIGQLAGGMAHDFNNMLGGIMGAAQIIKKSKSIDGKNKKYVDIIIQASIRAADLTSKLLTFGRKEKITPTTIDINEVIDDTISLLERSLDKKIKLIKNIKADHHHIIGNNTQLQNAFMNIGINSSHAMPDGGIISYSTANVKLDSKYCKSSPFEIEPGEYFEVETRDNGNGIPNEILNKIFEPFFTTKKQGDGTGLGLTAVYGTIQEHNGAITVYSEEGVGTVFHIYLPVSIEAAIKKQKNEEIITGSGTILVVDDEEIIRITAKSMLEEFGYKVLVAEDGKDAVKLFKKKHNEIDLVFMDVIMPEMNGREAFYEMKIIDPDCKVFISSGFTKNEDINKLKEDGLCGFIHKPYHMSELSRILGEVLKG